MYLLNKSGQVLSETTFMDSRFRGNDSYLPPIVIPAKAGIQWLHHYFLRCYNLPNYGLKCPGEYVLFWHRTMIKDAQNKKSCLSCNPV